MANRVGLEAGVVPGKELLYMPVHPMLAPVYVAAMNGDVEALRAAWRPQIKAAVLRLTRDESCNPLLNAVHRLHVEAVRFLLQQGLSSKQRGTVLPYTGDNLTVGDVKGVTATELIDKMLSMHPRRSKRRDAIDAVKRLLAEAEAMTLEQLGALEAAQLELMQRRATAAEGGCGEEGAADEWEGEGGKGDGAEDAGGADAPSHAAAGGGGGWGAAGGSLVTPHHAHAAARLAAAGGVGVAPASAATESAAATPAGSPGAPSPPPSVAASAPGAGASAGRAPEVGAAEGQSQPCVSTPLKGSESASAAAAAAGAPAARDAGVPTSAPAPRAVAAPPRERAPGGSGGAARPRSRVRGAAGGGGAGGRGGGGGAATVPAHSQAPASASAAAPPVDGAPLAGSKRRAETSRPADGDADSDGPEGRRVAVAAAAVLASARERTQGAAPLRSAHAPPAPPPAPPALTPLPAPVLTAVAGRVPHLATVADARLPRLLTTGMSEGAVELPSAVLASADASSGRRKEVRPLSVVAVTHAAALPAALAAASAAGPGGGVAATLRSYAASLDPDCAPVPTGPLAVPLPQPLYSRLVLLASPQRDAGLRSAVAAAAAAAGISAHLSVYSPPQAAAAGAADDYDAALTSPPPRAPRAAAPSAAASADDAPVESAPPALPPPLLLRTLSVPQAAAALWTPGALSVSSAIAVLPQPAHPGGGAVGVRATLPSLAPLLAALSAAAAAAGGGGGGPAADPISAAAVDARAVAAGRAVGVAASAPLLSELRPLLGSVLVAQRLTLLVVGTRALSARSGDAAAAEGHAARLSWHASVAGALSDAVAAASPIVAPGSASDAGCARQRQQRCLCVLGGVFTDVLSADGAITERCVSSSSSSGGGGGGRGWTQDLRWPLAPPSHRPAAEAASPPPAPQFEYVLMSCVVAASA